MSAGDAILRLLLVGEDKSASKAVESVGEKAKTTGDKIKKHIGDSSTEAGGKLGKIKDIAAGVFTADMAKEAGKAIVDFGKDSIGAYRDAEAKQRLLQDAFERFPALAGGNIDALRTLNDEVQRKTGFDNDDLAAAQATMAQYGLNQDQLEKLTPLMADYAAKTGKDLPNAAQDLGKAMLGQGRALKDIGIDFKDTHSTAGNFQELMSGLGGQLGGFAEKEASSVDGKMKILNAEFEDMKETIGEKLLPIVMNLVDAGLKVIDWATRNKDVLIPLGIILGTIGAAIGTVIGAQKLWTLAQLAFNLVMDANPIAIVIVAIAALTAGIIYAYQHSQTFRDIVDTTFHAIGAAGEWLWNNALQPVIKFIVQGFVWVNDGIIAVLRALGNIPGFGWAKDAADLMSRANDKAREMADGIKKIPDKTVDINFQVTANYSQSAQQALALSRGTTKLNLPGFAGGGRPPKDRWSIVGEDGPELFKPDSAGTIYTAGETASMLSGGRGLGGGGGNTYVSLAVTVQGDSDPLGAAKRIETKLMELSRSRGGGALNFKTI